MVQALQQLLEASGEAVLAWEEMKEVFWDCLDAFLESEDVQQGVLALLSLQERLERQEWQGDVVDQTKCCPVLPPDPLGH